MREIFSLDQLVALHDAVQVVTHDHLRHIAHEIIEPVVDACQYAYGLVGIPVILQHYSKM